MAQKIRGGQQKFRDGLPQREAQARYDARQAREKARWDEGLTPSQWEKKTGNKLIDYSVLSSGNLSRFGTRTWMPKADWEARQKALANPLATAYEKMGIGKTGDLGGRMGELEKASMRLGEFAAQRRLGEIGAESASRLNLQTAQADIEARQLGYKNVSDMQKSIEDKRREEDWLIKQTFNKSQQSFNDKANYTRI